LVLIIAKYLLIFNDNRDMKKFNFILIHSLTLSLLLTGCMPDSLTKFKKDPPKAKIAPATTETETEVDPSDPPNLSILSSFQLRNITANDTSYHMHKYGKNNQSAACEIPIADLEDGDSILVDGSSDILCWLEAEEIQLYFNGANLQVNAPAGQCEYIQVKPYYYWNAQPKNTQKKLKQVTCGNPADTACTAVGGANTLETEDLTCEGDYTSVGGPNCDEGYVQTNVINITAAVAANASSTPPTDAIASIVTSTVTKTPCGGKRTNCYGGPGVDFKLSKNGYPIPVNYLAFTGQSINYSITAPGPMGKGFDSNHYISNFTQLFVGAQDADTKYYIYDYTTMDDQTTGFDAFSWVSTTETDTYAELGLSTLVDLSAASSTHSAIVNIASDPLKRANSTLYRSAASTWITRTISYPVQAFYEFSCLNFAQEVKGRIRLQIRDWNKKFQTPVLSEVSESAPESLLMHSQYYTHYETSGVGYWNDITSWDFPYPYIYIIDREGTPSTNDPLTGLGFLFPELGFNPTN
jgi:hypothetical protein